MKYLKSIEQVNEYGGSEFSKITALKNFLYIDMDKFRKGLKDKKHLNIFDKAKKAFWNVVGPAAEEHHELYESVAVGSAIHDVSTELPAKAIALPIEDDEEENGSITEGKDIGSWNQGGLKGNKNVLITTFVGPPAVEEFGLGRKCMQINVGMDYIALNPADIVELKDLLKSYKVK